ncbi:MAG: flagellar hook-basal body complex protein FliE [Acidimicrobiales bacterium]
MIGAIGGIGAAGGAAPVTGTGAAGAAGTAGKAGAASGEFGSSITKALDELDRLHGTADQMANRAATGELESVTDYLVAATEAQLATQVTVAVRNKAVEAFNDIMRMQV